MKRQGRDEDENEPEGNAPGSEFASLGELAEEQAVAEGRKAKFWHRMNIVVGLPTAVLAGAAAVTGFATAAGRVPAAILAVVVACLSAASTFLGCESRARAAERKTSAWTVLARDARVALTYRGSPGNDAALGYRPRVATLNDLTARQGAILRGEIESALSIRERTAGNQGRHGKGLGKHDARLRTHGASTETRSRSKRSDVKVDGWRWWSLVSSDRVDGLILLDGLVDHRA